MEDLSNVHTRMAALAISVTNLNELVHMSGEIILVMNDLEEED